MKTVLWKTEEKEIENFLPRLTDCFEWFLDELRNQPIEIKLNDGASIRGILLDCSFKNLIAVEVKNPFYGKPSLTLIRGSAIVSIAR